MPRGSALHQRANPLWRALLAAWIGALVLPCAAVAQRASIDGSIVGRVVDEINDEPIVEAFVEFLDRNGRVRATAVTDADGSFSMLRLAPGPFSLRVTRIGYARTTTPYWQVQAGELLSVTVRVHPRSIVLAPLEINMRTRSNSPVLSSFYRRMELRMGGVLISREEIERRSPGLITDLLVDVPGIRLDGQLNNRIVTFSRALPGQGGGAAGCPVQVYVDGVLARASIYEAGVALDELATPAGLEGLEVYRGIGTVPAEFLTPEARCGVIALWTRRGG